MTGFQLFWVNRDGCHIWGRKCSLFLKHFIPLPLGSSWFRPVNIIYITAFVSLRTMFCLPGLVWLLCLGLILLIRKYWQVICIMAQICGMVNWPISRTPSLNTPGFGFRTSIRITTWHRICVKPDHLYNTQSIDQFNLLPMFPNKQ